MIPIADANPRQRVPIVTILLIVTNMLAFLYQVSLPPARLDALLASAAVIPIRITQAWGPRSAATLVTATFLHGSWMHLLSNMLYLWIFGDNVEDILTPSLYFVFYLASGIVGSLAQVAVSASSSVPIIGASGAVAGILGAYIVLFPRNRVRTLVFLFYFLRVVDIPAVILLGMWFVLQLFNGLAAVVAVSSGGVAWFAHLGGFSLGIIVGILARLRRRGASFFKDEGHTAF